MTREEDMMRNQEKMTAREFLREMAQSQSRAELVLTAATEAFMVGATIAVGMAVQGPGWVRWTTAAILLVLGEGTAWWALGTGWVQRWIRTGRAGR